MRYSTFAASLFVSSAAAWRLPDFNWGSQGWYPVSSSAVASVVPTKTAVASVTHVATTVVATATPTPTVVADATTKAPTAAGSAATGSSGGLTADEQSALDAHNNARAEVGTADLTWDASLAADALAYAQTLASSGTFEHSGVSDQGENLYMQSNTDSPLTNAVNAFVEEKSSYNGEAISSTNYMIFGHYTQAVWKDTTKVGMGFASGSSGTYVVARYQSPGNFIGEKAY
ncbi:PR-1-like protein [Bimuria novae-zelandiae CBS 107.79]|uniref:PR-1-like protein n=1 Tax=Bimuria novae-zelandiae CBS 107.79 TaxID=1447943 RepID=A0A6A5USZ8_9PLEO|nr:PR-1-like protein [Bimuria novae-zelandiae CBS 107.79]